jgi:hypothetical protein
VAPERLASLKPFAATASVISDCGLEFIVLPGLKVPVGGQVVVRDALLCPSPIHGYVSRLFLSEPIAGKGQNWNQYVIAGTAWWAPSWQSVESTLPLPQMLLAHLDAFA